MTPNLPQVISGLVAASMRGFFTALPARVETYDSATRRCTATPLVMGAYVDEGGARVAEALPTIAEVPVLFLGAGDFRFKFPVRAGDTVLLLFTSCSLDLFLARGGAAVDDPMVRRNDINDAFALPMPSFDSDDEPSFEVTDDGEIHLGGGDRLAKVSELNDLRTFVVANVVHAHAAPGGATSNSVPVGAMPADPYTGTDTLRGG